CSKPVFGNDGITVLGIGAAHVACFELEKNIRRVFAGINISQLDEHKLNELHDMVLAEKNHRSGDFEENAIELF
ncbi:MAG: DUF2175 domain-containing protein, partial [Bermanella sp.]|nr:DUF2175 domain-containing protein [Bermanella sp.]